MLWLPTATILLGFCCSCASSWSEQPLHNARSDGEVYPYGASGDVVPNQEKPVQAQRQPRIARAPKPQKEEEPSETEAQASQAKSATSEGETAKDLASVDFTGEYRGFDEVAIRMDPFPERKQRDDAAILRVESDGEFMKAIVIDTREGHELCALRGTPKGPTLTFEAGQQCFSGLMGVPVQATLKAGKAHLEGDQLVVDFEVELELAGPAGEISGSLSYHFEGSR